METDLVEQNSPEKNMFKFDYDNQNMDDNINFLKWKESIVEKNNNNKLKLFKCQEDKIFFYSSLEDYYLGLCPLCHQYICFFCLFPSQNNNRTSKICCLKRLMNICFCINGPKYIKRNNLFTPFAICFLVPGINLFMSGIYITAIINNTANKKEKIDKKFEPPFFEDKYIFYLIFIFFVLAIPFFFLNTYLILGLILISIPFKLIPLKYYLGLFEVKESSLG